ncbi:MAG: response regulator transcription factor [Methylococcales bacterium]|nr:response regulator transcription factor [Methylococcales bacterium]
MVRVLLVDDHVLITTAIKVLLNNADNLSVIGVAESGEQAILAVEEKQPDVVLMDVEMPGMGGTEACRRILKAHPETKIIGLSQHDNNSVPKQLLKIGAVGFISKNSSSEEMIRTIHKVMSGDIYLCADVVEKFTIKTKTKDKNNPCSILSPREFEVVRLILQGKSIQDMVKILGIKDKTINTYRYRIYKKLDVKNDVELVRLVDKFNQT